MYGFWAICKSNTKNFKQYSAVLSDSCCGFNLLIGIAVRAKKVLFAICVSGALPVRNKDVVRAAFFHSCALARSSPQMITRGCIAKGFFALPGVRVLVARFSIARQFHWAKKMCGRSAISAEFALPWRTCSFLGAYGYVVPRQS